MGGRVLRGLAWILEGLARRLRAWAPDLPNTSLLPGYFHGSLPGFALACRRNVQVAPAGDGVVLCRVMGTFLAYGRADDVGLVPHLAMDGYWEPATTLALARALRPGWTCVDVGANHGYFTLLMAQAVGPGGRVVACEPQAELVDLMRRSLSVNGFTARVEVHAVALADTAGGTVSLGVPERFGMNASITRTSGAVREVPVTTLDALLAGRPVDLIKIDVEGAEEKVWAGLQGTLAACPSAVVVLEFNTLRHADPGAFLDRLAASGYRLEVIEADGTVAAATRHRLLTEHPGQDWMLWLTRPRGS